ncbi:hypothetical protein RHGRI_021935 [Rhododendron griersonianum]|uniref:Peptidase C1A papain C-terminal domain-containing protein n=1 Tax=Rhododendron griersonianum TaxID=479676 RepID=A0AAV6JQG8_9ERIC|nr:hypothetical protein RHGRI_021935 [Rhododendron griersonianum]
MDPQGSSSSGDPKKIYPETETEDSRTRFQDTDPQGSSSTGTVSLNEVNVPQALVGRLKIQSVWGMLKTRQKLVLRIQDYECFHSRHTEEGYRKICQAIFAGPICGEFSMYKGIQTHKKENGIYKGVDAKGKLREIIGLHAVSMVGYGDKARDKCFEIKNSWDKGWCDGGYAEMDPLLFGRIGIPIGVSLEDKRVEYLLSKVVTIAGLPSEQLAKRRPTQDEEDALSFREAVYALSGGRRDPDARWINWFIHTMPPEHLPTFRKLINLFQQCKSGVLGSGHGRRSVVVAAFLFYIKNDSKLSGKVIIVVPPNDIESWSIALKPFFQITTHHHGVMEKLKGKNKLLITPENPLRDVEELISMLCFLLPKYFRYGKDLFKSIVEKGTTHEVVDMLNSVVDIFNVDNQPILEHEVYCVDLGEGISVSQKKIIREIYKMPQDATREGIDREQALDQLLAMVKCCNHLSLSRGLDLTSFNEEDIENTGFLSYLMTRMLDVLEQYLKFRGKEVLRIDETSALEECKSFCAPTTDNKIVRLLSTRAGCLGISLLPVDALIFYDTNWWNPHIDTEVKCCAPKEVMVYYLFTMGIFEETVQKLKTVKRDRNWNRNMDIRHAFKRQEDVDDEWWLVRAIRVGSDLCHSEESTIANADFNVDKVSGGEPGEIDKNYLKILNYCIGVLNASSWDW